MSIWKPGVVIPVIPDEVTIWAPGTTTTKTVIPDRIWAPGDDGIEVISGPPGAPGATGAKGDQGEPGPSGAITIQVDASGAIGEHRIVRLNSNETASYASNLDVVSIRLSVGMTLGAAIDGDPLTVQIEGLVTELSWSWTPDAMLYLGVNGLLTEVPPTAPAFLRVIATAISTTKIFIHPESPIIIL